MAYYILTGTHGEKTCVYAYGSQHALYLANRESNPIQRDWRITAVYVYERGKKQKLTC